MQSVQPQIKGNAGEAHESGDTKTPPQTEGPATSSGPRDLLRLLPEVAMLAGCVVLFAHTA
jgi:hypothetical protein